MAAALTVLGVAVATLPWAFMLRGRIGGVGAVATVTLAVPALVMALMFGAQATGMPLGASVVGLVVLTGVAGWVMCVRAPGVGRGPRAVPWAHVWPAATGAGVAAATFLLALVVPGASRLAWAMLGDSASQFTEVRLIFAAGGVAPPPLVNPVPLTPALVAATGAPGRTASDPGALFLHDLSAYASTWAALIVASCLLAGMVAHGVVSRSSRLTGWAARFAVTGTSLLPLGWFWTGYPIKFGFINAHVAYVVVLATVAAYLGLVRKPWLGLALQLLAAVLLILTWSPLAVFPAVLGVAHMAVVLRGWRELAARVRVGTVAGVLAGVAVAVPFGLPLVRDARSSLTIAGGLAEFPKPMLAGAAAVLLAGIALTPMRRDRIGLGLAGIGIGALVGQVAILALAGQLTGPWSYYPHKYAWLATAVVLTVAVPVVLTAAAGFRSRVSRVGLQAGMAVAIAVSLGLGSWWLPGQAAYLGNSLPVLILVEDDLPDQGQAPGAVPDAVAARAGAEPLTIPWRSDLANDYRVAFWLIHLERERAILRGDGEAAGQLWVLANFHEEAEDVCALAGVAAGGLTVETSDAQAAEQLDAQCSGAVGAVVGAVGR